jgi:4-hydroxysphinganine ceramide fatty acyl 2-hydroxylase
MMNTKPNHNGRAQIFKNPVLEKLTKTHIALPISIFIFIAAGLFTYGLFYGFISLAEAVMLFLAGWLIFSFLEYCAHRFIFHMETDTAIKERIQYTFHGNHHEFPKDKERLAMPPIVSVLIASLLFFIFKLFFGPLVFGLVAGILFGYAMYLFVHYAVHAYAPPKNIFKTLWIHHSIHHYKDSTVAYGVSSPLWDYILRTMPKKSKEL